MKNISPGAYFRNFTVCDVVPSQIFPVKPAFGVITKMAAILTGSKYHLTESQRKVHEIQHVKVKMTTKLFVLCFSGYLCHIKKSTVLQISGLNERTGGKSGIKWKCNSFKAIHFSSEFLKKCETMIPIFKYRKGQTYEQI